MTTPTNALQARLTIDRLISTAAETDHSWFGIDSADIADRLEDAYQQARRTRATLVPVDGAERSIYIQRTTAQMALYGRKGR